MMQIVWICPDCKGLVPGNKPSDGLHSGCPRFPALRPTDPSHQHGADGASKRIEDKLDWLIAAEMRRRLP